MTGAAPKPDMTVVIKGNRITALGRTRQVHVPRGALIVDAAGKFLIPGLWDMHVHFTETERSFPMFVANGVTGVRNMGGDLDDLLRWRAEVASGKLLGPRIVTCGPIIDGPQPAAHGPTIVVGNAAEGREAVDTLKQRGADCVKVYDRLPRDAYFAIIDEAKKQRLPVVGHVPLSITSVEASAAGQKSIEHLGSILEGASTIESELQQSEKTSAPPTDPSEFPRRIAARGARMLDTYDEQKARQIFAHFIQNQTWQVPTLEIKWTQTFIDDLSKSGDPRLKYIPQSEQQWWSPQKNFFARYRTPEYIVFKQRLFRKELELVGAMHRAGVPFMTGTDLSGAYVFAGFSLHHELEMYVQAGFSPMEALQAATRNPAMFLDELSSQGTVETGKIANLVLLDANPLDNVSNIKRIDAVILNGSLFPKTVLRTMLANVEQAANAKMKLNKRAQSAAE
jgi:cytosine/adenosine deaminase-related metal-dependent hydrolase